MLAATVPLESMAQLSTLPGVEVMEGARRLFPTNDVGVPETGAPIFRNATGQDGTGVIVGVIDTGVDFTHPDFRNLDGSTRIIFLCDQTDPPQPTDETCPGGGSAAGGTLWTQAQINAALAGAGTVRQRDLEGHGTHVLGSAAGNDGTFGGMAPGADIVVVKAGDSGFSTANILSAIDFIDAVAAGLGSPYVINMSLGGHIGPHDGTDLQSQAINSLTGPGNPGKVVVVAAGNEGGDDIHASGNVASGTQSVSFNIPTGTEVAFIDIWYDGQNSFSFGFLDPNNSGIASLVSPGQASAVLCNGPSICLQAFHSTPQDNTNGDIEVFFVIFSSIGGPIGLPGIWSFSLTGAGAFDAWISCVNGFCEFSGGDTQLTIGEPGVAAGAITVGSYATKDCWPSIAGGDFCFFPLPTIGEISGFSSRGPARDGRVKPDIAAPGQVVVSALSSDAVFDQPLIAPDYLHFTLQGTSMATPQVAGAVALLLAENPNLDAGQIKTILQDSAFRDAFTDPGCTNTWGCGKLDISALAATLQTLVSDSLDRADADRCALGEADLALGGAGSHFYLPLWPTAGVDPSNPIGANIDSLAKTRFEEVPAI